MRSRIGWLKQIALPIVLTLLAVLALVGVTAAAGTASTPALLLARGGHWAVDPIQRVALHVHGDTHRVDARVALPDEAAESAVMTVQGGSGGYVVGTGQVWQFDTATLTAGSSVALPVADEEPVAIETPGGPYLVYRGRGTIVRLGSPEAVVDAGGALGPPVHTSDGTVWVHRTGDGTLCAFRRDSIALDCGTRLDETAVGALTVVADVATFVDTGTDTFRQLREGSVGAAVPLATDLPADALVADQATATRLPVVHPGDGALLLVGTGGITGGREPGAQVEIPLGAGTFSAPFVSGQIVAVLELEARTLLTFDELGSRISELQLPPGTDAADIRRGEDGRIYVDEGGGARTHVVRADGTIASVDFALPAGDGEIVAGAAPGDQLLPIAPPPVGVTETPGAGPNPAIVADGGFSGALPGAPGVPSSPGSSGRPAGPIVRGPTGPAGVVPQAPSGPGLPAAPVDVTATLSGVDVTVTWAAGAGGGPATSFTVTGSDGRTAVAAQGRAQLRGLTPGQSYTFTVTASNGAGTSARSAPSNAVVPRAIEQAPAAPPQLSVDYTPAGTPSGVATVSWTRPDLRGGVLVRYVVTEQQGGGALSSRDVTGTSTQLRSPADFDACEPVVIGVYAVTTAPGGGPEIDGDPAVRNATVTTCPADVRSSLRLTPASATVAAGGNVTFAIRVAVGSEPVNAVQANLLFANSLLGCGSIAVNQSSWPVTAESSCADGSIRIAVGAFEPVMGTVDVATVTLTAVAAGTADVVFVDGTSALSGQDSTETLGSTSGGTYTITG